MGDVEETQDTQDTQTPPADAPEAPPAPEGEAPEAEQPADVEAADGEAEAPEGEAPPAGEKTPAPDEKHRREGGFQRTIKRLERQLQERDALLAQALGRLPQPAGAEQPKLSPEQQAVEQLNTMVQEGVHKALAEQRRQEEARALAQEWEQQMPEDEAEAYEVRRAVTYVHQQLPPGPLKEALLTSKYTPRILSTLLRNPAELARLDALPPGQAAREIGRFEAQFAAGANPATKPKPVVRPPAPPSKVGGTAPSTRSLEDLPLSEYKRAYRSRRS